MAGSAAVSNSHQCHLHESTIHTADVPQVPGTAATTFVLLQTVCLTVMVLACYVAAKSAIDRRRQRQSRATIIVIGAGPSGLIAALVSAQSCRASRVIVWEERDEASLTSRSTWLTLNSRSVQFLRGSLGVDVKTDENRLRGSGGVLITHGKLTQLLLSAVQTRCLPQQRQSLQHDGEVLPSTAVELRLSNKFTRESLHELENIEGRIIAVVCDGRCGRAASLLGLSDECVHHSCRAYGAVAAIHRNLSPGTTHVPVSAAEIRVHNVTVDLSSVSKSVWRSSGVRSPVTHAQSPASLGDDPFPTGFHVKLFGNWSTGRRCMALAVPRCESTVVKALRSVLDHSIMRGVLQVVYNRYKSAGESSLTDDDIINNLKFSPRLFEIKLADRLESVTFIEDANIFVVVEGSAARKINFNAGTEMNIAITGLESLESFIDEAACSHTEQTIIAALNHKFLHSRRITQHFVNNAVHDAMYT